VLSHRKELFNPVLEYFASLPERLEKEAQSLAKLTHWSITAIRKE
jgi:hypothetical protein